MELATGPTVAAAEASLTFVLGHAVTVDYCESLVVGIIIFNNNSDN